MAGKWLRLTPKTLTPSGHEQVRNIAEVLAVRFCSVATPGADPPLSLFDHARLEEEAGSPAQRATETPAIS
jgi:hypothetical protein